MNYFKPLTALLVFVLFFLTCNRSGFDDNLILDEEPVASLRIDYSDELPISETTIEKFTDLEILTIDKWSIAAVAPQAQEEGETFTHYLNLDLTIADGKQIIARVFGVIDDNGIWIPQPKANGMTAESCHGDPCPKCRFAFEGGCECDSTNPDDRCNHKITRS